MTTEKETLQRVQGGLYHLRRGLTPFVEARMKARHGSNWLHHASRTQGRSRSAALDEYGLLKTMLDNWHAIFDEAFGRDERHRVRNFTSMAYEARNVAYHAEEPIKDNEALRFLDAMHQLLSAVKAPEEEVAELARLYNEQRLYGLSTPDHSRPEPLPPKPSPTPAPLGKPPIGPASKNMTPTVARRRVNQRCKLAVLNRDNSHFASIGRARSDIWWFDIPLKKVEGPAAIENINLLLYNNLSDEIHHLRVPSSYLRENIRKPEPSNLRVRADKKLIDLYLSTDNTKLFQDLHSECRFQHLACGCNGREP